MSGVCNRAWLPVDAVGSGIAKAGTLCYLWEPLRRLVGSKKTIKGWGLGKLESTGANAAKSGIGAILWKSGNTMDASGYDIAGQAIKGRNANAAMKLQEELKLCCARLQGWLCWVGTSIIDSVIGWIPYHVSFEPGFVLEKKNKYRFTKASPRFKIQLRSLDRVSRVNLQLVKPWFGYQGPSRGQRDINVILRWTSYEGWWIEGEQTGRRTRPMPRLVGALLCGTLILMYPELLRIVLTHAEKTERYVLAYVTLAGVTLTLAGLVGFYMWLGFKSGPSGLEHALKQFSKVFGDKDEKESSEEQRESEEKVGEEKTKHIGSHSQ